MQLSDDERRALGIIAALLVLAAAGRWLERPRPILEDVPELDLAALEQASIEAKGGGNSKRSAGPEPAAATSRPADAWSEPVRTTPRGGSRPDAGSTAAPTSQNPVDLSHAPPSELEQIRGVGPVLAARLAARRDSLGGFTGWEQVDAVPGIGPAMLARLKELAVLGR